MIDTDITRALALAVLIIAFAIYLGNRREQARYERRAKLQGAARTFADALIEFAEDTAR